MEKRMPLQFPERREKVRGIWQPLYLEPVLGSGERLCVGMLAVSQDEGRVFPVPGLSRLSCLYGADGLEFIEMILLQTMDSLEDPLATSDVRQLITNNEPFNHYWEPPFSSILMGEPQESAGNSIEEIAENGFMMCASLTAKEESKEIFPERMTRTRVENDVKHIVASAYPNLLTGFGLMRTIDKDTRSTRFGFIGNHLALSFAVLSPRYIGNDVSNTKSKLYDIHNLKKNFGSGSVHDEQREDYEVFIHTIDIDDNDIPLKQRDDVKKALHGFQVGASSLDINIFHTHSASKMAERILLKERLLAA